LGLEIPNHIPTFDFFNSQDLETTKRILLESGLKAGEPFMVVVPGARYPLKSWDADRFGEIARQIEENLKRKIVILGSQNESEAARLVASTSGAINLCGKLPIEQSAAVISMAELVLSNDSALMHLANALNIPCVSLFGPTNRVKYGFENEISRVIQHALPCVPCEKAVCQIEEKRKCMTDISVAEVFSEIKNLLQHIHKVSL
jgi:ADP-heptose:LPS heptosyltransferase